MGMVMKMKGLNGDQTSFMIKMFYNILPTRERLYRMSLAESPFCDLCTAGVVGDLSHSFLKCDNNGVVNDWLLAVLLDIDPGLINADISSKNIISFNLQLDTETLLPVFWLLTTAFSLIWKARVAKKVVSLHRMKATIEAELIVWKRTNLRNIA